MKVKEVMTPKVIRISPEETAAVAARTLTHYNIGVLPVCDDNGKLCGILTDRDVVTRCVASNRMAEQMSVEDIMTARIVSAHPAMDVSAAAHLMSREQVRRLPVLEGERLCGMVSVGDLACREDSSYEAAEALEGICSNLNQK